MSHYHGRREPYTARGIRRVECYRKGCRNKAAASFTLCANGQRHVPVCSVCDRNINAMVLEYLAVPNAAELMAAYEGAA